MHDYYSTFGYIQSYASTNVSVFLDKMCKTNIFFYFGMTDTVALTKYWGTLCLRD